MIRSQKPPKFQIIKLGLKNTLHYKRNLFILFLVLAIVSLSILTFLGIDYIRKEEKMKEKAKSEKNYTPYTATVVDEPKLKKISLGLPKLNIEDKKGPDGSTFQQLKINGTKFYTSNTGAPKIPFIREKIQIPANATNIKLDITNLNPPLEFKKIYLDPVPKTVVKRKAKGQNKYQVFKTEFTLSKDEYQKNEFLPKDLAKINKDGYFRSMRMLEIDTFPVVYNAAQKTLKYFDLLEVSVTYDVDASTKTTKNTLSGFEDLAKDLVLNYKDENIGQNPDVVIPSVKFLTSSDLKDKNNEIDYLVITHPDFYSSTELNDFLQYRSNYSKLRIGVAKADDIYALFPNPKGKDYQIRDFVRFGYNNWLTTVQYLLLLGDTDWIPTHFFNDDPALADTDDFFGYLSLDDEWDDVAIGRWPARNVSDIETIFFKVQNYEQNAEIPGDYHRRALYIEGEEIPRAQNYIDFFHIAGFDLKELYYNSNTISQLVDAINQGQSVIYYSGHGWGDFWSWPANVGAGFSTMNFPSLNNKDKYSMVFASACGTGCLTCGTNEEGSLGEEFLRVKDKGAVSYYGSTVSCAGSEDVGLINKDILDNFDYSLGKAILKNELQGLPGYVPEAHIPADYLLIGDPALQAFGQKLNQPKPDLTLRSADLTYDAQNKRLKVKISNIGNAEARQVNVKVSIWQNINNKIPFADLLYESIPAKSAIELEPYKYYSTPSSGNFWFEVKIDPENKIDESSKFNNQNGKQIDMTYYYSIVTIVDNNGGSIKDTRVSAIIKNDNNQWESYAPGGIVKTWKFDNQKRAYLDIPVWKQVYFQIQYDNWNKYFSNSFSLYTPIYTSPANVIYTIPRASTIKVNNPSLNMDEYKIRAKYRLLAPSGLWDSLSASGRTNLEGKSYIYLPEGQEFSLELLKYQDSSMVFKDDSIKYTSPQDIVLSYPAVKILNGVNPLPGIKINLYEEEKGQITDYDNLITDQNGEVKFYLSTSLAQKRQVYFKFDYNSTTITTDTFSAPFDNIVLDLANTIAPVLNLTSQSFQVNENQDLKIDIFATDTDSDKLYFSTSSLPDGAQFIDNGNKSASLSFKPNTEQQGTYTINIKVSDGFLSDNKDITISVTDMAAPKLKVTKEVDKSSIKATESMTYTIVVENIGNEKATNVTITDMLYFGLLYIAGSSSPAPEPTGYNPYNWSIGDLLPGQIYNLRFQIQY